MHGPSFKIAIDAAAFDGEFKRMFLAAGIIMLVVFVMWGIQEWGIRKSQYALGWLGLLFLALIGTGAAILISVGLL